MNERNPCGITGQKSGLKHNQKPKSHVKLKDTSRANRTAHKLCPSWKKRRCLSSSFRERPMNRTLSCSAKPLHLDTPQMLCSHPLFRQSKFLCVVKPMVPNSAKTSSSEHPSDAVFPPVQSIQFFGSNPVVHPFASHRFDPRPLHRKNKKHRLRKSSTAQQQLYCPRSSLPKMQGSSTWLWARGR